MLEGTCHCGKLHITMPRRPRRPRRLTACNCSICRRYGTLWAYFKIGDVRFNAAPDDVDDYAWGDKSLKFVRCRHCGCVMAWLPIPDGDGGRMGVNARNFDPAAIGDVRIRRLDGADTWKYID